MAWPEGVCETPVIDYLGAYQYKLRETFILAHSVLYVRKIMSQLVLFCLLAAIIASTFAQQTNFINRSAKVRNYAESGWFLKQIPFIDIPDSEIEEIYYYRWSSHKRHLRYTLPGGGYSVTEFIHKVFYAGKYDTIVAAAGHHIFESRWLRDRRFNQVSKYGSSK